MGQVPASLLSPEWLEPRVPWPQSDDFSEWNTPREAGHAHSKHTVKRFWFRSQFCHEYFVTSAKSFRLSGPQCPQCSRTQESGHQKMRDPTTAWGPHYQPTCPPRNAAQCGMNANFLQGLGLLCLLPAPGQGLGLSPCLWNEKEVGHRTGFSHLSL